MPHFHPNTLIIELESLSISALLSLFNTLIKQGVSELYISIAPSVVDITVDGKTYSIAIAPFTLIIPYPENTLLKNLEFKIYRINRDAWIDGIKLKTQQLLSLLTALISNDYRSLVEYNIIVESKVDCEDIIICFPLTVKGIMYSTQRERNIIRAYTLYKEMLRDQKILIAVCVVNNELLPYAWIEKREGVNVLVLKRCEKPGVDKLTVKIVLDYIITQSSEFGS